MPPASPPRRNWTASTPSEPAFSPTPSTPTRPSTPTNGHAACSSAAPQDLKTWEFSRQILGPNGASISLGEKDPTQGGSRHRIHGRPCPRAPVPAHAGLRSGVAPAAEVGADAVRRRRSRRSQGPEGLAGGKGRSPGCRQATGASQDHRDRANRAQLAHPARRSRHADRKRRFPPRGAGQPFTLFARPASLQDEAFQPLGIEPAESDSSKATGRFLSIPSYHSGIMQNLVASSAEPRFSEIGRSIKRVAGRLRRSHAGGLQGNQVGATRAPHAMGGIRSAHGRAASKAAAARKMSTSRIALEMTCRPTGSPSPVNPTGKDAPGLPVRLNG